jgi:hypothetical protein
MGREERTMISVVRYHVGTYSGEIRVLGVDPNEEPETVCARARKMLARRSGGSLPFGSQSFREVSREEYDEGDDDRDDEG